MKSVAAFVVALAIGFAQAHAADEPRAGAAEPAQLPERAVMELEPAGVASGTTVRQARIAQNWLLLTLGSAALAGIIFGLSSSSSSASTTTGN